MLDFMVAYCPFFDSKRLDKSCPFVDTRAKFCYDGTVFSLLHKELPCPTWFKQK